MYCQDNNFNALWKAIELSFLKNINEDVLLLWKAHSPESVLRSLGNIQLAESLRSWYLFRENATIELYDSKYSEPSGCQLLWYNRSTRSKSKQYFFLPHPGVWYHKVFFVYQLRMTYSNQPLISSATNYLMPKLVSEISNNLNYTDSKKVWFFALKNIPREC